MAYRPVTSFVLDCDICLHSLDTGDHVALFSSTAEARQAGGAEGWLQLPDGRDVCPRNTPAHNLARTEAAA